LKRKGRKSAAQTPAPAKERVYGSKKNPSGSAASKSSASKIQLSSSIVQTLKDKATKYNKTHKKDVSTSTLAAVMRRGMGAYSKSHRPTITGGAPNSRQAWGFARVNKFLKKKSGEPVKKAYIQDDDLLENGGLLASNGKKSNLTPEQYKLVRTPEFKAWFGDWDNDPENASKVVDENGEPMVVYHGTSVDFTIFLSGKPTIAAYGKGFYFTNDKAFAQNYARGENGKILNLFLNIRKIFEIYEDELPIGYEKYSDMESNKGTSRDFTNKLISQGYNGVYAKNKYNENEIVVFEPNQIKLADGSNTTFDSNNPDIRYDMGAELPVGKLARGMSLSEVAAKHNLTADDLKSEFVLGIETEKEHTDNPEIARAIALDHLFEDPKYYTKLKQMEGIDTHLSEISAKYANGGSITPIFQFNTPTGEKSSLTYLQQVLVRTKAFKTFFGDWEGAAKRFLADNRQNFAKHFAGVSLVLDYTTFEPKALYHGTRSESEFFRFDVNKDKGMGRPYGYFAHNKQYSQNFTTSSQRSARSSKPYLYEVFLDVRKPFYANTDSFVLKNKDANSWRATIASAIAIQKYAPNKPTSDETMEIDLAVESQIGKYIESVYKNGNAPFWKLMAADVDKDFKYFLMSYGFDGIFYSEEFQSSFDPDDPAQFTRAVTIFDSKQVKLADGRNLNFDALIDDIRYDEGGDIEAEPVEEKSLHMNKKMKLGALLFGDTYAEGGEVIDADGNKTNDGKKGGYFKGRSHAEGGIKAVNVDTGQLIEVEGNEVIITKGAVADNTKREFEGEMLTNREILSKINQSGGGVSFEEGGELKEGVHTCGCSGKKYNYGGELLEDFNIITKLNEPYDSSQARVKKARAYVDDLIFKMQ
jgi:hypothetical protein